MAARRYAGAANVALCEFGKAIEEEGEEASVGGREESYVSIHHREGFMVDLLVCS